MLEVFKSKALSSEQSLR